jgi:hypothetical protein
MESGHLNIEAISLLELHQQWLEILCNRGKPFAIKFYYLGFVLE